MQVHSEVESLPSISSTAPGNQTKSYKVTFESSCNFKFYILYQVSNYVFWH